MAISRITPDQLHQLLENESSDSEPRPILLDVRTPMEFQEVHALPARNVPLDQFDAETLRSRLGGNDQTVYLICRSGDRAAKACLQLQQAGIPDAFSVVGGTLAWDAAGLPVHRGKVILSLERQVRIAVGAMVAIGGGLAVLVSPLWGLVPLAAGLGLVFAGITGSCAMGMMLAKMPWNNIKKPCDSLCCASS